MSTNPAEPAELPTMDGAYAVVVECQPKLQGGHLPPRHRRRVYLSLAPAERAVERAHVAGLRAKLTLYRLVPAEHA
ncbi:hypothetical protein [Glutamicibacter halophytocola]|uniref:hypothetical protein n=1 Tax=Glutamicibacter halophytocola TaxID=1933880 RepID=UPI0015C56A60|nr:hypothetical protein [Glutamicibacter halophytocola]NQD42441.1 hypothetical protein [Glutamicibacter halophytocola]